MISEKDVIKIRIPYPNITDNMAKHAHMYAVETPRLSLFSIQTAKPFLVEKSIIENYITLECGNDSPVKHKSYLTMDIRFILENVSVPDELKAENKLSDSIFTVLKEKSKLVKSDMLLNKQEVLQINKKII